MSDWIATRELILKAYGDKWPKYVKRLYPATTCLVKHSSGYICGQGYGGYLEHIQENPKDLQVKGPGQQPIRKKREFKNDLYISR